MRVLFDISSVGGGTGIARVVREVAGLARHHECHVTFCATGSLMGVSNAAAFLRQHPEFDGAGLTAASVADYLLAVRRCSNAASDGHAQPLRRVAGKAWEIALRGANLVRTKVPSRLLDAANIFHSPFGRLSGKVRRAQGMQRFLTFHDMLPLVMPDLFTSAQRAVFERIVSSVGPHDWLICVSESTRNDLCEQTGVRREQTFVAPLAAHPDRFWPCHDSELRAEVRSKYKIPPGPYLLSVASLEPRKNLALLVRSFARLLREARLNDVHLVLAGGLGWQYESLFETIETLGDLRARVSLIGYVDDAHLAPLYSDALAFVYPSLYEGFGLPPLEAMQCGTPVVASNTSSLPEVVGDAGILVDPTDEQALGQAMLDLVTQRELRERLSARSLARAATFSWSRCIDQHVAAYRWALDHRETIGRPANVGSQGRADP